MTRLLDDDQTASMATALMMSHHAFRRDIAQFARALRAGRPAEALAAEWAQYRAGLHHHHTIEDTSMFPGFRAEHPSLASVFDGLEADHRRIDPLLERGDRFFADLPAATPEAIGVVEELTGLLDAHLATEETHVIPFLRAAKSFPSPATDAEADMYAEGFAWACHGIAPTVLAALDGLLPPALSTRLPAARAVFAERCLRVWGTIDIGVTDTSIPALAR